MGRTADLKIFAGNSNPPLAAEISQYLKVPLGKATVDTFSDGESKVEIKENVRGADVFVLQSTSAPGNNNLMELLLMLDAFKRASAQAHYRGHALLRLCAPGPQGRAAGADQRQIGRRFDHRPRALRAC